MEQKLSIILAHRREGKSIRRIAHDEGMSRRTVRKYLREYERLMSDDPSAETLDAYMATKPRYDISGRQRRVITPEVVRQIDALVAKNRENERHGLRKQLMRKIDMWRYLRDSGVNVAYSTVCQYVRALENAHSDQAPSKAFIRQEYIPGSRCEFDWGVVYLWIDGQKTKLHMAVFTLNHSNMRMAYLFSREDSLALMEAHRNFFRHIGGTPAIMAYDNMRTVVKRFLGREREHTDTLKRMELFYCFAPHFCNARSGWEKGKVERSVEYVRRRAFSLETHFDTLEQAQRHLLGVCERLNAEQPGGGADEKRLRIMADIAAMRPLEHGDMGCFEQRSAKVDKYSTVTVCSCRYSVPDRLVGQCVAVKLYSERVVVLHNGMKVASHARRRQSGCWSVELMHYLGTFLRKPAALGQSAALQQVPPQIAALYKTHFRDAPREFVHLLAFAHDNNLTYRDIANAAERLTARGLKRLSGEQIQAEMLSSGDCPTAHADADDEQQLAIERCATSTLDSLWSIM